MTNQNRNKGSKKRARRAAGTAGARTRLLRTGNSAIVTQDNLLHFGLDWLSVFIVKESSKEWVLHEFFEEIFDYQKDDVFETAQDIHWPNTTLPLEVRFGKGKGDVMAYFHLKGDRIISVRKITPTSTYPNSVTTRFQYNVAFYGEFFALGKLQSLNVSDYLSILAQSPQLSIVSQIHVCLDIENINVKDVWDGVCLLSPHQSKDPSFIRRDPVTGIAQTIYYGQKGDPNWYARIYNKLKEINDDLKQRFYPQYWGKKLTTRVEVIIKRPILKKYEATVQNCLDDSFLLSLLKQCLIGKYVVWKIMESLESVMLSRGYQTRKLEAIKIESGKLTEEQKYQRLKNQLFKFASDYALVVPVFLRNLADDYENSFPK